MNRLRSLSMMAALGLASAAYAQTQAPPDTTPPPGTTQTPPAGSTDPNGASSPHQRDVTAQPGTEATPSTSPDPSAAASPHQRDAVGPTRTADAGTTAVPQIVGLEVDTPAGERLGAVVDLVLDPSGQPAYVVIATPADAAAVPYRTASSMVQGNKVVVDRAKLKRAPKVKRDSLKDSSNTAWQGKSDAYWNEGQGSTRSASPGTSGEDSSTTKPQNR